MKGVIKNGLVVAFLGMVMGWATGACAVDEPCRKGLFDRLRAQKEDRRLMPDEMARQYKERSKNKRAKRSLSLMASFIQSQSGTKLTDHQLNLAYDRFPDNDILFLSDMGGQLDLWRMESNGSNKRQLTNTPDWDGWSGASVSPSGQKIVYDSMDFSGQHHLYVMNADGTGRIELDVSVDGLWVDEDNCWSPNNQWILYEIEKGTQSEVWVAKADGTVKNRLPEEIHWSGNCTWSPNGNWIVYSGWQNNNYGLYKVSPNGGTPIAIVTSTTGWLDDPTYSPDGSWIAYSYKGGIYKINPDGGTPISIFTPISSGYGSMYLTWSPDGNWIAIEKSWTCSPANNDWDDERGIYKINPNGGTPIPIATSTQGWFYNITWSPNSQWILYGGSDGLWAAKADGTANNLLAEEGWSAFFLSDSSRVVYGNLKDIYTILPTGGNPTNLTNNPYVGINGNPIWSPDGNRIAYLTMPNSNATGLDWTNGLWVMDTDGRNKKEIATSTYEIDWSPDGNWIAYRYWQNNQRGIYKVSPNGGAPIAIVTLTGTSAYFSDIDWSPDGNWIAYIYSDWLNNVRGIYKVSHSGGVPIALATLTQGYFYDIKWSPNGNWIAYSYRDYQNNQCGLYKVSPNGGSPTIIVTSSTQGHFYDIKWSPDGSWIAYNYRDWQNNERGIYVIPADGGSPLLVYESDDWIGDLCWSPDSTKIAFAKEWGGDSDLSSSYYINLDGSGLTRINAPNTISSWGIDWSSQNVITYNQNFDIWVNTQQESTKPILFVSPNNLNLETKVGQNPLPQTIQIKAVGGTGQLSWTASSNQSWLTLSSKLGNTPSDLILSINVSHLTVGSYQGRVTIEAGNAADGSSPKEVLVNLLVRSPEVDCAIVKTGDRNVKASSTLTYKIYAANRGADEAGNVVVTDTLPAGVTYQASTPAGTYHPATHTVTWNLGTLSGASLTTLTLVVFVPSTAIAGTTLENRVEIRTPSTEITTANNSFTHRAGVVGLSGADLEVCKWVQGETPWIKRGFKLYYYIYYSNLRFETAANTTIIDTLPEKVEYISSSDNGVYTTNHTVTWNIGSVTSQSSGYLMITVRIPADTENGACLTNRVDIQTPTPETDYKNNSFTQSVIVGAAIDPNDKSVYPAGDIQATQPLSYLIHYENIGSVPTTFINVEDLLDSNLDEGTLIISGGGNYATSTRKLTWTDNVQLDPGETRGVSFMVYPKAGLPEGTQIKNKATIYFDYEPGLTTNEVVSSIIRFSPDLLNVRVYPNPYKLYDGNADTGDSRGIIFDQLTQDATIRIFNIAGELVRELSGTGKISWDARNSSGKEVASGVYIYLVTGKNCKNATGKVAIVR